MNEHHFNCEIIRYDLQSDMNHYKLSPDAFNYVNYESKIDFNIIRQNRSNSFDLHSLKKSSGISAPKDVKVNQFDMRRKSCTCSYCGIAKLSTTLNMVMMLNYPEINITEPVSFISTYIFRRKAS